jgi:hypothetical protein
MTQASQLDGIDPSIELEPEPEILANGLPYISKSRIKTYKTCPRKFFWKYICGERAPGTYYTERGTQVHETFEEFHATLSEFIAEKGEAPKNFTSLLPSHEKWGQWIEMVGHFFAFERRRMKNSQISVIDDYGPPLDNRDVRDATEIFLDRFDPIEIEAEAWLGEPPESWINSERGGEPDYVSGEPPVGEAPWMGRADLIVDTRSVPEVSGDGVTIIDYKTGSVPDERYRDEGIFLEGEYYGMLFEEFFDVDAVAGYYPGADELIVSPYPDEDRRKDIRFVAIGMQREPTIENFNIDQQPLCHWNNGKGEGMCHFHEVCPTSDDCGHCGTESESGSDAERYQ